MDATDRKICALLQANARTSSTEVAEAVGLSVSSANERIRRLAAQGVVQGWHAVLDRQAAGAALCAHVWLDMAFEGEAEACEVLVARPEVLELHHVVGAHSYLMKLRLPDTRALQSFLNDVVKPLRAVQRTESVIALSTLKETLTVPISGKSDSGR
ncbi:Lrp/AsnC family transcriptional regulator [Aliiruegeria haliotis]|nr:Lrp/AsnC family transcriptional regulator [Aliiruegeria haliotis]